MPQGLTLLIVDDDDTLKKFYLRVFPTSLPKYKIVIEESGETALSSCKQGLISPDVALIDVNLPGISGIQTAQKLKEMFPNIILFASSGDHTQLDNLPEDLFSATFEKPFLIQQITPWIIGLVEQEGQEP